MLGLVMDAVLALVESWKLVHLPHLKVVDFFHHRLPQSNPCIDEPVRHLHVSMNKTSVRDKTYRLDLIK